MALLETTSAAKIERLIRSWQADNPAFLWCPTRPSNFLVDQQRRLVGAATPGLGVTYGGIQRPAKNGAGYIEFPSSFGIPFNGDFFAMILVDIVDPQAVTGTFLKIGGTGAGGVAVGGGNTTMEDTGSKMILLKENVAWIPGSNNAFVPGLNCICFFRTNSPAFGATNLTSNFDNSSGLASYNAPTASTTIGGAGALRQTNATVCAVAIWPESYSNSQNNIKRAQLAAHVTGIVRQSRKSLFTPERILVPVSVGGGGSSASATPAAGTSVVSASGSSAAATTASAAAGASSASAAGAAAAAADATPASGASAASGAGASTAAATATPADGTSTVSAVGSSSSGGAANPTPADGSSSVSAVGASTAATDSSPASGASVVSASASASAAAGADPAAGSSSVGAVGVALAIATATPAPGASTVGATGASTAAAAAAPAAGASTVSATTSVSGVVSADPVPAAGSSTVSATSNGVADPTPINGGGGGRGRDQMGRTFEQQVIAARQAREAEDEFNEIMAVLTAIGAFA